MKKTLISNTYPNEETYETDVELATTCPLCHTSLVPITHYSCLVEDSEDEDNNRVFVLNHCPSCDECFISRHTYAPDIDIYVLDTIAPVNFNESTFSSNIRKLSPDFVNIYNEAAHAESLNLTSIYGMGYRKALEFLVKDFAISNAPDSKEEIEKMSLAACIEKYIEGDHLKTLAKASAWLGNDETHYVKKHTSYGVNELKIFINTFVTFIDADLAYKDAQNLVNSR